MTSTDSTLTFHDPAHAQSTLAYLVMGESSATPWHRVSKHTDEADAQEHADRLNAAQAKTIAGFAETTAWLARRGSTRSPASQRMADYEASVRYAVFVSETLPLRPLHPLHPLDATDAARV
jgi:hypothetical protein